MFASFQTRLAARFQTVTASLRHPAARALVLSALALVVLALVPTPAWAQASSAIDSGKNFLDKLVPLLGKAAVVAGILLIIVGGWAVRGQQGGGWAGVIMGVFLIFVGIKLASQSSTDGTDRAIGARPLAPAVTPTQLGARTLDRALRVS